MTPAANTGMMIVITIINKRLSLRTEQVSRHTDDGDGGSQVVVVGGW